MEASKHQGFYQHVTLFQGVGLLACAESFRPKNGLESPDAKRTGSPEPQTYVYHRPLREILHVALVPTARAELAAISIE